MQRIDEICLVRLTECEPVQEALLSQLLESSLCLAQRHVEHQPLDASALNDPPWRQSGWVGPVGVFSPLRKQLPRTLPNFDIRSRRSEAFG